MFFFTTILSLTLASGFYLFGQFVVNLLKLNKIISKVSNPVYQYTLIGISFFLFITFPSFFLFNYERLLFQVISYLFIFIGILNFYINYNVQKKFFLKFISIFRARNYYYIFILIYLLFYFLYSLAPISSADSVAYHAPVAEFIIENGKFPSNVYEFSTLLSGSGEFLNAFAISINAHQFTSFIHFLGLVSFIGVILSFSKKNNLNFENKVILILLILSCPVLIFLIGSSKPQFFFVCCIILSCALLINVKSLKSEEDIIKSFFFSMLLCIICVQARISFIISFFLISIGYIFFNKKIILNLKFLFLSIVVTSFSLIPHYFWKQSVFNYSFYNFFFNPLPLNIPGVYEFSLMAKDWGSNFFPLSLFFPTSLSLVTFNLGIGLFIFFFFYKKFPNKKFFLFFIIFFFIIYSLFGQRSPRFYLEIYFLLILLFSFIINKLNNNFFLYFKKLIYFQSIYVFLFLVFGTFSLFPGNFTKELNHIVLSKNSYGYNLYKWVDTILPNNSIILSSHRGYFYSTNEIIYAEFVFVVPYKNILARKYMLEQIKKKRPNYILFHNYEESFNYSSYNFKDCISGLYKKGKQIGFHETRNPFNRVSKKYNGYIYFFNYEKLPDCVKEF
jgi:hypothetical protein